MRTRDSEKYEYALLLYMQGIPQKEIADRVGVSQQTLTRWKENGWEERRAAKAISMDELIAKTLKKINELLDTESFNADAFAKAVNQLKALKPGSAVNDDINVFMKFGDWLIGQMGVDREVTSEFLKKVTSYQDRYVQNRLKQTL